jgi:RNA polymerase sigma-70 factor (ECF subfamily)
MLTSRLLAQKRRDVTQSTNDEPRGAALFPNTAWTLVRRVQAGQSVAATAALESLCREYWEPVRRYLKALGSPDDENADVTQEFFASFLRNGGFAKADAAQARMRTFIKHAAGNFLVNYRRNRSAQKRGSGADHATLDDALEVAGTDRSLAEENYDRQWAETVFGRALAALEDSYGRRGRSGVFEAIKHGLLRPGGVEDSASIAAQLGVPESQVRLAVHRARTRLAEALRAEVAALVDGPAEVDDEVRYLVGVIANRA